MAAHALYLVRMDVAHDHEATFNEVYDREHVPNLRAVPGVRRASRYTQRSPLPMSREWHDASDVGRWKPEVRPYTFNKRFIVSERIVSR